MRDCENCKHRVMKVEVGKGTPPDHFWGCECCECEFEPTTKNDLGVDCIDRQAAITFACKNTKEILKDTMPLEVKLSDDYLYENVAKIMRNPKALPAVTPQEPKIGHWIAYEVRLPDRTILNYRCSVCGRKLIGYNTETLSEAPFCHCGARMVEPQESEAEI